MAHQFLLGYKANPSGTDDYIDLADPTFGYRLMGYDIGPIRTDDHGREVRDLKLKLFLESARSQDDLLLILKRITSYFEATAEYLEPYGGNIPASSDGSWHEGHAATLTVWLEGASRPVYWEVLDGEAPPPADYIDLAFGQKKMKDVQVQITVNADARGGRVNLDNLVGAGHFPSNFAPSTTTPAGWFFNDPTHWAVSTTFLSPLGTRSLVLTGSGSANSAFDTTQSSAHIVGDVLLPTCYAYVDTAFSGSMSLSFTLQSCVSGSPANIAAYAAGGVWANYSVANPPPVNQWFKVTGPAYTTGSGDTFVNLGIGTANIPGGAHIYIAAPALWRNPTNNTAPVEYASGGDLVGFPSFEVYNIQGDSPAPVQMRLACGEATQNGTSFTAAAQIFRIGGKQYVAGTDAQIGPLTLQTGGGAAQAALIFGSYGTLVTGTHTSATYTFTNTSAVLDRRSRGYRLFLVYALGNALPAISQTVVTLCGEKYYYAGPPSTYISALLTDADHQASYRIAELGDCRFTRLGTPWQNQTSTLSGDVTFTFASGTTNVIDVAGIVAIPIEQYAWANLGAGSLANNNIVVYSEADNVRISTIAHASTYTPSAVPIELNSFASDATYGGGNIFLQPTLRTGAYMHFAAVVTSIVPVTSYSGTQYTAIEARSGLHWAVAYCPRYQTGVAV